MSRKGKRTRRRRWPIIAGLVVLSLLIAGSAVVRLRLDGGPLARLIAARLNQRIRGTVRVQSIEWPTSSLARIVVGGFVPVDIRGIQVLDDAGEVVLDVPHATAEIDIHPALFGRHDLILRHIHIRDDVPGKKPYALIKQVLEPYPVHEYDRTTVSLVSAFYPKRQPAFRAGVSASPSPVFDLNDYQVEGATLEFRFPSFTGEVSGAHGKGYLRFDGHDPLARRLYYSLSPSAPAGHIEAGPAGNRVGVDLQDVQVTRLAQLPIKWPQDPVQQGLVYQAHAETSSGAQIQLDGQLKRTWLDIFGGEHDLTLSVSHAGRLAARLTGGVAHGKDLAVTAHLEGPVLGPKLTVKLSGVDLGLNAAAKVAADAAGTRAPTTPPLTLHLERATASFDFATDAGYLSDTVMTGAGGQVDLSATFNRAPTSFDLNIRIPEALDLSPFLPARARRLAGSHLSGSLHVFGTPELQRLDDLDLVLGRAHVTGGAYRTSDGRIHTAENNGLVVAMGRTRVRLTHGIIDAAADRLDGVRFAVDSTDTARWLGRVGAPPLVHGFHGTGHLAGKLSNPVGGAQLTLRGVPAVDRVTTQLAYSGQVLTVEHAEARSVGGALSASGKLILTGRPRIEGVEVRGKGLDVGRIVGGGGLVAGKADIRARASGPLSAPEAEAVASVTGLELAGERYRDTQIAAKSEPDGRKSIAFELSRVAGGVLNAQAVVGRTGDLSGAISLRQLPLESLTALGGRGQAPVGGRIDAELQLGGTPAEPTADGEIQVARGWFRQSFLGSADLQVERAGPGQVRVTGQLFQGKIEVDGLVSTVAPFRADLSLSLRRVEADQLFPGLAERYGARGWLSGEVRWRGSLDIAPGMRPEITANLSEAVLLLDNEDAAGRPAPIRLENKTPLSLRFDGRRLALTKGAVLHGPAGDFQLAGSGGPDGLDFVLKGRVSVATLAPYLKRFFDDMRGTLDLKVEVTGTLAAPRLTGVVDISKVALRPTGQDATVEIPAGRIQFDNDQLSLTGLSMVVQDEFSDERSRLEILGGVKLHDFRPSKWAVQIDGQLSGKMLLVVAPNVFSAASGSADLSIALTGDGLAPNIDGQVSFDPGSPLAITPRGLRREIALSGGDIKFTDKLLELEDVSGLVDDEGRLTDVSGEVSLENWRPVDIDVSVDADELPFRVPQTLDLSLSARGLRVVGGTDSGLEVSGVIQIVDGRYIRKWNPLLDALRPQRSTETSTPFYDAVPLLGNAQLNLSLETRAFFVKNNVADIQMSGQVAVTGTPRHPAFEGVIRVEEGSFTFEGVRAKFERTHGTVSFSRYRSFPDDTPMLDIRSESDYRDVTGQNHLIYLTLEGPLGNLDWDLTTSAGLNKGQTFTLIFAGRTPDDIRQAALGEAPIGTRTGDYTGSATTASLGSTSAVIVDQTLKQLAGEYFSLLMEDELRKLTTLDVVRVELGTSSLGLHVEKELVPSLRGIADAERSLRGWSWDARGEYRLNDTWSVQGGVQQKVYDDEAEPNVTDGSLKLTWRKVLLP